jgi:hypothetical protein
VTRTGVSINASATDQSGVLVTNSGTLNLRDSAVTTSGSTRSSDESSFYGLNAGVLANSKGTVNISGGTVTTTGTGANGVFAYGSGASASVSNATIHATGGGGHGAMTAGGGSVTLNNVRISTTGASAAALATDRGGGTVTARGGTMTTAGYKSPAIYSTGVIDVTGAHMSATGAEAVVVEGDNSASVTDTTLKAAKEHGVMLYQSMSGDAGVGVGTFTMTGGSLTAAEGPAFYITNTKAVINLRGGALVSAASGTLVKADNAGTGSGNTGAGVATLNLSGERLGGNLLTSGTGTITANLKNSTVLTGTVEEAALSLDSSSTWRVSGNSTLTTLSDPADISAAAITNIVGNGHTVTYDASLAANSALGGRTYTLAGGGELRPA